MKLIIDIPEEKYERIIKDAQAKMYRTNDLFELIDILKNGTPLDSVKAEIREQQKEYQEYGWAYDDVLEILDNIESGHDV